MAYLEIRCDISIIYDGTHIECNLPIERKMILVCSARQSHRLNVYICDSHAHWARSAARCRRCISRGVSPLNARMTVHEDVPVEQE